MAQTGLPNLGLNYLHDLGVDDFKNSYDANWVLSDSIGGQPFVLDSIILAEPVSPAVGDAYILPVGTLTGTNWGSDSGAVADSIALYTNISGQPDGSPWLYLVPREGWFVYDRAAQLGRLFENAAWKRSGPSVRNETLKIFRSTNYTLTTAFVDITFDTTTVETDPDVIEHNNTNTDDVDIKETGIYLILYDFNIDPITGTNSNITANSRVRVNDTTVITGSVANQGSFVDNNISGNEVVAQSSQSFVASLTAGDKITFQLSKTLVGGGDLQYDVLQLHFRVIRLK